MSVDVSIVLVLDSVVDYTNSTNVGLALVKTESGGRFIASYSQTIKERVIVNDVWEAERSSSYYHFELVSKKTYSNPPVLTFTPYQSFCRFEELKQLCLFYMVKGKAHSIFCKVSTNKAIMLEDNHRNDGFIVDGETQVIPYYLQGLSSIQKTNVLKVLDNYFMTE